MLSRLRIHSGISVEEIQNQVEVALMAEHYYTVAKNYMIYRYRTHQPQVFQRRVYQHGFHGLLYVVRRLRYARVHMVEAAEFLGIPINDNPRYETFVIRLATIAGI